MTKLSDFCPCDDYECHNNPKNHEQGCSPCVEESLQDGEIPACFFLQVTDDVDDFTDWSYMHFAELVLKNK